MIFFCKGKEGYSKLKKVLVAIEKYIKVGYVQGMNFVAAVVLVQMAMHEV
jgi:hypothetical protein